MWGVGERLGVATEASEKGRGDKRWVAIACDSDGGENRVATEVGEWGGGGKRRLAMEGGDERRVA